MAKTKLQKKVRVLSLDGGGIRGVIPATILIHVEKKLKEYSKNKDARIADYFDIIAGTSTGGILTCFYLTPDPSHTAEKALGFYVNEGYSLFNAAKRKSWFGLRQLTNATQYNPKNLKKLVMATFGNLKMQELLKPCLVTTYDMRRKSAFFFRGDEPKNKEREFNVRDVILSTSAAPTYFPPAKIKNLATNEKMVNLDGGVFANNPAMCVYAECRGYIFPHFSKTESPTAKDMLFLSIGTGSGQMTLPNIWDSEKWSVLKWAKSIPEIMMDGAVDTVAYQMKYLFGSLAKEHQLNYKRVDVPMDDRGTYSANMADASSKNIKALQKAGTSAVGAALKGSKTERGLDEFIKLLVDNDH